MNQGSFLVFATLAHLSKRAVVACKCVTMGLLLPIAKLLGQTAGVLVVCAPARPTLPDCYFFPNPFQSPFSWIRVSDSSPSPPLPPADAACPGSEATLWQIHR